MEIKNSNDIVYHTSKELGMSEQQVQFIVKTFWDSLRYFLARPLLTKLGILINFFGNFTVRKRAIGIRIKSQTISQEAKEELINLKQQINEEDN